jgi:hypothetical protein
MMRLGFMLGLRFPQAMRSEGKGSEEGCSLQCQQKGALCSASRRVLSAVPEEGCSLQCQKKNALCSARRRVLSAVPEEGCSLQCQSRNGLVPYRAGEWVNYGTRRVAEAHTTLTPKGGEPTATAQPRTISIQMFDVVQL